MDGKQRATPEPERGGKRKRRREKKKPKWICDEMLGTIWNTRKSKMIADQIGKFFSWDYFLVELHLTIIIQETTVVGVSVAVFIVVDGENGDDDSSSSSSGNDGVAKDDTTRQNTTKTTTTILFSVFIYFIFVRLWIYWFFRGFFLVRSSRFVSFRSFRLSFHRRQILCLN